jgi:hypothetical protein
MELLQQLAGSRFRFSARPSALPPDLRPIWRMAVLVLLLQRCCKQGRSSLKKLHVLNWAIRHRASQQALLNVLEGRVRPDQAIVRFDPALNRLLDFAKGEGLIGQVAADRFQITAKGLRFANDIMADQDCLRQEKWFIDEIAGKITETRINEILQSI